MSSGTPKGATEVTSGDGDNSLAKLWDADPRIREQLRFNNGRLLVWPKNKDGHEQIGLPSMAALAMNSHVMSITASWWCPTQEVAKTPSIPIIKQQAWGCFSKISCTDGPNDLYKNWGLSFVLFFKFFSCWSGVVVVFKNSILKITSSICRFFNHVPTQKIQY